MMKKLLITGFDPFGGETVNPSWEAVRLLPERIGEYDLTKLQIPTEFSRASEAVLLAAEAITIPPITRPIMIPVNRFIVNVFSFRYSMHSLAYRMRPKCLRRGYDVW